MKKVMYDVTGFLEKNKAAINDVPKFLIQNSSV